MSDSQDAIGLLRSFITHRGYLTAGIGLVTAALQRRAAEHDLSKLKDDEFEGFSRINAAARIHKFGSPEYAEGMQQERPTIDLHFSRNRHHPERPRLVAGIDTEPDDYQYVMKLAAEQMTFIDVIEMVCDWWAARKGYDDPRPWAESVKLNLEAKGKYLSTEQLWLVRSVAEFLSQQDAVPSAEARD